MASLQLSSTQILEAARRAEAEGKLDYAVQFYRHIVEHYGGSPEAYEARDAFLRLTQQRRLDDARHRGLPAAGKSFSPPPLREPSRPPAAHGGALSRADGHAPGAGPPANLPQVVTNARPPSAESSTEPEFAFRDRYRAGTIMALGANWSGWLVVGIGAALGGSGLAGVPATLAVPSVLGLPAGLVYGAGAVAAGLVIVFVSQLALAVFDNANASRHLLAIERAKADL